MASFDFGSGVRGAQAGASYGGPAAPYTALAGFVIGGFVGGHKKKTAQKKLKKKQKRYAKEYKALTDPSHYGQLVGKFLPSMRNAVATSGAGAQAQSNIATSLARGGYSGTGLGEMGRAVGYIAPEIAAMQAAQPLAERTWEREIQDFNTHALGENIGWQGQPIQKADLFGSAGGLVNMAGAYGSMGGSLSGMFGGGGGSPAVAQMSPTVSSITSGYSQMPSQFYGYGGLRGVPVDQFQYYGRQPNPYSSRGL